MEDSPENHPALYDLSVRQEVEVEWGEYKSRVLIRKSPR